MIGAAAKWFEMDRGRDRRFPAQLKKQAASANYSGGSAKCSFQLGHLR
jgi:hypothetical protein